MNNQVILNFTLFLLLSGIFRVNSQTKNLMEKKFQIIQVTKGDAGHCLYNTQCFSPDDQWIVFDSRNDDSEISKTGTVNMVNTQTFKSSALYHTQNQSSFGPGVGGVSFSPIADRVLFIHGIRNSNENNPYGFTRRTGVAIDLDHPFKAIFMDARNIVPPFTPGALRGGTHAHTWSGDGQWISFTYNDYIMEQLAKTDPSVKDLRTIGVMLPGLVKVPLDHQGENNSGAMFSVVVAEVTEDPVPGSNEVSKAFDECWIGNNGYQKPGGSWQNRAIAFQGVVKNADGTDKTEVFVLDLPGDLTKVRLGFPLEGTISSRPNVPAGIVQRRLTHSLNGVVGPRHWLRTTPDGEIIAFLSMDDNGIIQVFAISPSGGDIRQLTFNDQSVQGPFNFSPDGEMLAYIAGNRVVITEIKTGRFAQITPSYPENEKPVGAVIWSNQGNMMAFNRYVKNKKTGTASLQIFLSKTTNLKDE